MAQFRFTVAVIEDGGEDARHSFTISNPSLRSRSVTRANVAAPASVAGRLVRDCSTEPGASIFKKGIITDVSGDTFHLRTDAGEDLWFKPTPISIGAGLAVGDKVEIEGVWPAAIGSTDVKLFSARKIRKR